MQSLQETGDIGADVRERVLRDLHDGLSQNMGQIRNLIKEKHMNPDKGANHQSSNPAQPGRETGQQQQNQKPPQHQAGQRQP
ncbi:hypothetical protein [Paraburkholderia sp.]|uniref:hypothetical protein n=1 Tax=Paraburkholderia sp. TaxID=1926495 RepID=UPI0039E68AF1